MLAKKKIRRKVQELNHFDINFCRVVSTIMEKAKKKVYSLSVIRREQNGNELFKHFERMLKMTGTIQNVKKYPPKFKWLSRNLWFYVHERRG